jgi:hypothetical protein
MLKNEVTGEVCMVDTVMSRYQKIACGFMNYIKVNPCFVKHIILTQSEEQYKPKHINNFMNRMRRRYKKLVYIWTIEIQEERLQKYHEAVLHWHIIVGFKQFTDFGAEDVKKIQSFWKYGDDRNSVEIRSVRNPSTNYLMKYITKTIDSPIVSEYKVRKIGTSKIESFLRQSWAKVQRLISFFAKGGEKFENLKNYYWQNGNAYLWHISEFAGYVLKNKVWIYRKEKSFWFSTIGYNVLPF